MEFAPGIVDACAKFWGVSGVTVRSWAHKGWPIEEPEKLATFILAGQTGPNNRMLQDRARKIIGEEAASDINADDAAILEAAEKGTGAMDTTSRAAYMGAKLRDAMRRRDLQMIAFWSEQLNAVENILHRDRTLQKRLGLDKGTLYPQEDLFRLLRTLIFWANKSLINDQAHIAERLTNLPDPAAVCAILQSYFRGTVFLQSFVRASAHLPKPVRDCIREAVDDYVENGKELFDAESAKEI